MWVWLIISMVLVIACIVFGIYSFMSSRTLQKSISAQPEYKGNIQSQFGRNSLPPVQQHDIVTLKLKLKSMEESSLLNVNQLNELQKKVEALESAIKFNQLNEDTKWNDSDEEDWEKLYYEARREKQSLQENLNFANGTLEENKNTIRELDKQLTGWAAMKSEMELKINEVDSLQNVIDELQRRIEGANERERELEQQVTYEKSRYAEFELMQKENNHLRSEIEMLSNSLVEINNQNILLEQKLKSLTELGSILEISEYEKMEIKNSVEQLLQRNQLT